MAKSSRKKPSKVGAQRLLIPMHSDNWALSLASGLIGPGVRDDPAQDIQASLKHSTLGFSGQVPTEALTAGESGPRVILEVDVKGLELVEQHGCFLLKGLTRTTRVRAVHFDSPEALVNFNASYDSFPDIPVKLVVTTSAGVERTLAPVPELVEGEGLDLKLIRQSYDYFGGWAAGLVDLLSEESLAASVAESLSKSSGSIFSCACSLLRAIHPEATIVDEAIWGTVLESIAATRSSRGFDRTVLLATVAATLEERGYGSNPEVQSWLEITGKVLRASIDPPVLDDRRRIGQRAALASILAPDMDAAKEIGSSLSAGLRVQALVVVAARAFEGLSRLEKQKKESVERLDVLLDLAEGLMRENGFTRVVALKTYAAFAQPVHRIYVGDSLLSERPVPLTPLEEELKRLAVQQQWPVGTLEDGRVHVELDGAEPKVFVELSTSPLGETLVRLSVPLLESGKKHTISLLESYMRSSWQNLIGIGLPNRDSPTFPTAFCVCPTPNATTERLTAMAMGLRQAAGSFIALADTRKARKRKGSEQDQQLPLSAPRSES